MKKVVLLHQREVLHYRVAIYNRLDGYLAGRGWQLVVVAQGVQPDTPHEVRFVLRSVEARTAEVLRAVHRERPDAVIMFVNAREKYLFPVLISLKLAGIPAIYWGHGLDLEDRDSRLKRVVYRVEHSLFDALLLYSEHLQRYIPPRLHRKTFIARNTIDTSLLRSSGLPKRTILERHGIGTSRNVICVGRLQRRKRLADLIAAFERIDDEDCGLILVGPDTDGCLADVNHPRIRMLGPLFGPQVTELLEAADVYCMPGHVGLGIVDAMHYGLPFVTEDVDHAPEIMYLKHGINGYMVPAGDVNALAERLNALLKDDLLRARLSAAAKQTVAQEASVERMFAGFGDALAFVAGGGDSGKRSAGGIAG